MLYTPPPTGRPLPTAQAPSQPPAPTPQRYAAPVRKAPAASAGKVMYFHKPADALVPVSGVGEPQAQAPINPPTAFPRVPEVPLPTTPIPQAPPGVILPPQPVFIAGGQDDKKDEQPKFKDKQLSPEDIAKYTKLETRERIFSIPDDATLERYVRMKSLEDNPKLDEISLPHFPALPDVGGGKPYVAKTVKYPPMRAEYYSLYVVHRRLHFEDKNAERYGWDLGIVQPLLSAANFYKDVFLWPQSLASGCAYGFWDTNAGKCLPGSPTPYMLYPPGLTITGSVVEGVIITGAAFAIP